MKKNYLINIWNLFSNKIAAILLFLGFLACSMTSNAQYCAPTGALDCTDGDLITNVTFGTINNNSTCGAGGYTAYPISNSITPGTTIPISVTVGTGGTEHVGVWIDYNQNNVFEQANEFKYLGSGNGVTITSSITVPAGATPGNTKMRVRVRFNVQPTGAEACDFPGIFGEVEDYNISVIGGAPCTGTPNPGNTVATSTSVCSGTSFTLSLQNNTSGSGVTYQWQSGTIATGPFTNIAGATSSTYTSSTPGGLFYRSVVTCSGNAGNSTPVQVNVAPASQCYCTSGPTSTADEDIFNVTVGTLNNSSTCASLAPGAGSILNIYSNYTSGTGAPAVPDVVAGANNPFSVGIGTCGGNFTNSVAIWIDLNQDGAFTANERVYNSPAGTVGPHTETGVLVIPATALLGNTRMRVVSLETGTSTAILPCGTNGAFTWGETEDYTIKLVACVSSQITTNPSNATTVCGTNATFTAAASGTFPTYQWQYRINATAPWQVVTNAPPYSGANTATLTVAAISSLNGYQYRAIVTGACIGAAPDPSTAATLTVTPITIAVTPANLNYCKPATPTSGTPVLITVPNNTQTVTVNSNLTTPLAIPDGPATAGLPVPGVNTALAVSGIPVGANILRITVKVNITHPYVGDLILNLKSPTSTATTGIINLCAFLNGGTGLNATANFTNTVFASDGVTPISGAAAPRTGTFRGDYFITTSPPLAQALPSNGGGANVNNWGTLLSTPNANGNWVLYLADGGATDVGTLSDWSISITYGAAPASAVFTPSTGLFTNAAGTVPYTGTAVSQVYAAPNATTTYVATVSSGACTGLPQNIKVNVDSAVGGTATLTNAITCAGKNTSFVLGGALIGGPTFTHNYQVSTDNGVTFTNITNGGVYSGANTNTLVLTGVPASYNGYRYRDSVNTPGGCGFKISTGAILTVNPTPVVTISAAPITKLFPGLTTTLTANSTPAGASYQWIRNGSPVVGATSNTYVVTIDALGSYTVNVTDVNTCSNTATTPASITISDSANADRLFIYPSPNLGQFQVRYFNDVTNTATAPAFINVFDEKGTRVFSKSYSLGAGYGAMNVDLGIHGKGVYRVDLLNSRGERIKTGSVMVF